MRTAIENFRSGLSMLLLSWAFNVAPEREKTSLATAINEHCQRTLEADAAPTTGR